MENPDPPAFHCPSCGALTEGAGKAGASTQCEECGYALNQPIQVAPRGTGSGAESGAKFVQRDVRLKRKGRKKRKGVQAAESGTGQQAGGMQSDAHHVKEEVLEDGRRRVMKRRRRSKGKSRRPLIFVASWVIVLFAVAVLLKEFGQQGGELDRVTEEEKAARVAASRAGEVRAYLGKHLNDCQKVFDDFLQAGSPSARAQFVRDPIRVTPRMSTYYQANLARRPQGRIELQRSGLRVVGEEPVIEMLWKAMDGEFFEVAFVRREGKNQIDWEEFVRYSSVPWHRFLDGTNEREGEFRLYMRRRQVSEENEGMIGVQFYPAVEDPTQRQRGASEAILVKERSAVGQQLLKVWGTEVENEGLGGTIFPARDPEGLRRVRVQLGWEAGEDGEDALILRSVVAGHWWGEGFPALLGESGEE